VFRNLEEALELIQKRARDDPELAGALRTVLEGVLARLPEPAASVEVEDLPMVPAEGDEGAEGNAVQLEAEQEPVYVEWPDLSRVGANLTLKARAARWVATHGYTEEPTALAERYALLDEAREAGCYLWMLDRNRVDVNDAVALAELADLFELTARVFAFWQDAGGTPEEGEADALLAEVQMALRVAAYTAAGWRDPDQYALYRALRLSAQATGTFLPQLSLEHEFCALETLQARLEALEKTREAREERERTLKKLRGKARYLAGLVAKEPAALAQWREVEEAVGELHALGSSTGDLLAPLRGLEAPPEVPHLAALLGEKEIETSPAVQQEEQDAPSELVKQARELLEGQEVVIVGGEVRSEAVKQLEAAFGCRVRWLESAPHTSLSVFEPAITGEVAVVLLLIRWSSHAYGELVHVCKAQGVPLVRLAGGYSPNRVAHDVLSQAGERLKRAA